MLSFSLGCVNGQIVYALHASAGREARMLTSCSAGSKTNLQPSMLQRLLAAALRATSHPLDLAGKNKGITHRALEFTALGPR